MGSLGQVDIRSEEPKDWTAVHAVNTSAFPTPAESDLVDTLRGQAQPIVSLVAVDKGRIVGHIMFSPEGHEHQSPRIYAVQGDLVPISLVHGGSQPLRQTREAATGPG